MIDVGRKAPAFRLRDQSGKPVTLASVTGQWVALYFYPRDDTPGCTKQACSFRDTIGEIGAEGAVVLGVSVDTAESHQKFRAKYSLNFPLLVDEGESVATEYGAWGEKKLYGRTSIGMTRATFIIGPDGLLTKVWKRARAADHAEAVLKALRAAK